MVPSDSEAVLVRSRFRRPLRLLGYICTGLGAVGLFVPLLPTTPFLLAAAWIFTRIDPTLSEWLYGHPRFGAPLRAWRDERAIPLRAKLWAMLALSVSWLGLLTTASGLAVPILGGLILASVGLFIITRPLPGRDRRAR